MFFEEIEFFMYFNRNDLSHAFISEGAYTKVFNIACKYLQEKEYLDFDDDDTLDARD
jgi:hypothetical protein